MFLSLYHACFNVPRLEDMTQNFLKSAAVNILYLTMCLSIWILSGAIQGAQSSSGTRGKWGWKFIPVQAGILTGEHSEGLTSVAPQPCSQFVLGYFPPSFCAHLLHALEMKELGWALSFWRWNLHATLWIPGKCLYICGGKVLFIRCRDRSRSMVWDSCLHLC